MRPLLLALCLVACSDPAPPPRPEVRPEPAPAPVEEPEAPTPPVEDETAPTALELPDAIPVPAQLATTHSTETNSEEGEIAWPVIAHPSPEVREVLTETLRGVARELGALTGYYGAGCDAHLAHESLVSATCSGSFDTRGGIGVTTAEVHLAIAEGRVRPFAFADAFLPDMDPRAMIRERCHAELERRVTEAGEDADRWEIELEQFWCDSPRYGLGPRGVVVTFANPMNARPRTEEIPWAELRERIRADGPLAPVLADRPARWEVVSETSATGYAVTEFGAEPALVRRWMDAESLSDAVLVVDDFGGGLARIALPERDEEGARRIARALGAEAEPIRVGAGAGRLGRLGWGRNMDIATADREAVRLRWVRTTEDLNLRPRGARGESSAVLAVLPAGSLVAAVGGELRRANRFVDVVTALGPGALASRHLRPHEGCVVPPGPDARHAARVSVRQGGAARDAWLVVSRRDRGSHVALHAAEGESCALGAELLAVDVERAAFDVRLAGTTAHGGDTLLVVGASGAEPGAMRYRVWRVGARAPVLDEVLAFDPADADLAVRLGETVGDVYFPITLERERALHRYAWVDGALVEAPAAP